jgi:hypothetical protein
MPSLEEGFRSENTLRVKKLEKEVGWRKST